MDDADLLVVAGGAARRLAGLDKALVRRPDGRTVLAGLLAAPVTGRRVVAGPPRAGIDGVVWVREDPPGGGPVAALAAAAAVLVAPRVVVLAGDLARGADAVPHLLAALPGHDAAMVTATGREQWLLAAWHTAALRAALARLGDPVGARVGALYAGIDLATVPDALDPDGRAQWSGDLDTPADLDRLRRSLGTDGPDRPH